MTISSLRLCAASFLQSLAVASETGFFGTWLCSMGSKRSGAILRLCLLMDPLWMQRPTSESDSHRSQMAAWRTNQQEKTPPSGGKNLFRVACAKSDP